MSIAVCKVDDAFCDFLFDDFMLNATGPCIQYG